MYYTQHERGNVHLLLTHTNRNRKSELRHHRRRCFFNNSYNRFQSNMIHSNGLHKTIIVASFTRLDSVHFANVSLRKRIICVLKLRHLHKYAQNNMHTHPHSPTIHTSSDSEPQILSMHSSNSLQKNSQFIYVRFKNDGFIFRRYFMSFSITVSIILHR